MVTVKVSILLQYIALFVTNGGTPFHYSVQGLIWINVLYYTITTILFVTEVSDGIIILADHKSYEHEKMLMVDSVPLSKSCGNRPCLGIAVRLLGVHISSFFDPEPES